MAVKREGAPRVLETRADGPLRMRRYRKANGLTFRTVELPLSLWIAAKPYVQHRIPGFVRAEAARDRIHLIKQLLAQGEKCEYIAAVVGTTGSRVRQIKARGK